MLYKKKRLNIDKRTKEYKKMVSQKVLSIVGIAIMVVVGWDKISNFLNSFFQGISEVGASIPPLLLIVVVGLIIWWLGNKK